MALWPDGNFVLSGWGNRADEVRFDNRLRVHAVPSGRQVFVSEKLPDEAEAVAVAPDGKTFAYAAESGAAHLLETASCTELRRLPAGAARVRTLAFSPDAARLAALLDDGTIRLWDLTRPEQAAAPRPLDPRRCWDDLAQRDTAAAYRTLQALEVTPDRAVLLLRARLRPVAQETPERIRAIIARLDADDFERREAAGRELVRLGPQARPYLRDALEATASFEVQRRVPPLQAALSEWVVKDPELLSDLRGVWLLQRPGTPEARALLAELAAGAPEARLTQEARASLDFLDRLRSAR